MIRSASCVLNALVNDLESLNHEIYELNKIIRDQVESSHEASLMYTILGIISRFFGKDHIFLYAVLVPRIHQSGKMEWKGHIAKGNAFLKYLPVEYVRGYI